MIKSIIYRAILISAVSATPLTSLAETPWAIPKISVACVREKPGHAAELGTQVIMGTPLKVVDGESEWKHIQTPDGYEGYVIGNSLQILSDEEFHQWQKSERMVVISHDQAYIYSEPTGITPDKRISDVVNGSILQKANGHTINGYVPVSLPDGRSGYIHQKHIMPLDTWINQTFNTDEAISLAKSLMGTPYLWGGTSTKAMDCSGLTKICYLSQRLILPRNASAQASIGIAIPPSKINEFEPGDLLMFGNKDSKRVNHVGIYLGNGRFIHCSGRVKINSLHKGDADYAQLYLLQVRRLDDKAKNMLHIANHPWF